jgi:hypothetical protein
MNHFDDFVDPGDLSFFEDNKDPHLEDESEDFSEEGWVKEKTWADDVEVVTNPDGSGSFRGTLKGMGF